MKRVIDKHQQFYLRLQHLNHFEFFCDQLHILRKMTFTDEKYADALSSSIQDLNRLHPLCERTPH